MELSQNSKLDTVDRRLVFRVQNRHPCHSVIFLVVISEYDDFKFVVLDGSSDLFSLILRLE
jgi:hypothetical protein